ncbi:unnamed protein product [Ectocarpus sp. CCAP 1310/34]|nr:unnamed protein product [Ectocarpus sp. CCAP 1310/34]
MEGERGIDDHYRFLVNLLRNIKTALVNKVKRSLNIIDISTTQQSPIVLVFAVALCPQHEPVDWLLTYLEHQEVTKAYANVTVDSLKA